jgi:hypothetical protein
MAPLANTMEFVAVLAGTAALDVVADRVALCVSVTHAVTLVIALVDVDLLSRFSSICFSCSSTKATSCSIPSRVLLKYQSIVLSADNVRSSNFLSDCGTGTSAYGARMCSNWTKILGRVLFLRFLPDPDCSLISSKR